MLVSKEIHFFLFANSFILLLCQNLQIQQTPNPEAQDPALAPPETKVMRCLVL